MKADREDIRHIAQDIHRVNGQLHMSDLSLKVLEMVNLVILEIHMLSVQTCTQKV